MAVKNNGDINIGLRSRMYLKNKNRQTVEI